MPVDVDWLVETTPGSGGLRLLDAERDRDGAEGAMCFTATDAS